MVTRVLRFSRMTLAHGQVGGLFHGQSRKLGGSKSKARGPGGQHRAPASRPPGGQKSSGPSEDEARVRCPCRAPSGGSPRGQACGGSPGGQASGGSSAGQASGGSSRDQASGGSSCGQASGGSSGDQASGGSSGDQASGGSSGGEAGRRTSGAEESSGQESSGRRHETDGPRVQRSQVGAIRPPSPRLRRDLIASAT